MRMTMPRNGCACGDDLIERLGLEDEPGGQEVRLGHEVLCAWEDIDAGSSAAYRWEDAGCSGYATHVTGNDNMHWANVARPPAPADGSG